MSDNILRPNDKRHASISVVLEEMLGDSSPKDLFGSGQTLFLSPELSPQGIISAFDAPEFRTSAEYNAAIKALRNVQKLSSDLERAIKEAEASLNRATKSMQIPRSADGATYPPVLTMALVYGLPNSTNLLAQVMGDAAASEAKTLQREWDTLFPKEPDAKGVMRRKRPPADKRAYLVAKVVARIFAAHRNERPTPSMDNDGKEPSGPYMRALKRIFKILGIGSISVKTPGLHACNAISDDDLISDDDRMTPIARALRS